jgi:hypothetical protein
VLLALGAEGCQNGYPIAPTLCDEWCDQTQQISCETYDPAGCVASCEKTGISSPACASFVQQTLNCLHDHPNETYDCGNPSTALSMCTVFENETIACASTQSRGTE